MTNAFASHEVIGNLSSTEEKILFLLASKPAEWLTTRYIADCCEINIYDARYYLMKMLSNGFVHRKKEGRQRIFWSMN